MAGGDPSSGSSKQRGEVQGPGDLGNLTPQEQAQISSVGRVMDEAQKQLRGGDVDPALLKDLAMTPQQFRTFVDQYTQRLEKVKREPGEQPAGQQQAETSGPGGAQAQSGRGMDSQVLDVRGGEKLSPDQLRKLNESRSAKVSPEYRKQVEDYFRAISEGAGGASGATGGSSGTGGGASGAGGATPKSGPPPAPASAPAR